jgi:hypothetical protein
MEKMQEESKIYNIQEKTQALPQTKVNHKHPLKLTHMDGNIKFQTPEGSKKSTTFLNAKYHTPPEPRQIKPSVKFNQRRQLHLKWRTQGFIK